MTNKRQLFKLDIKSHWLNYNVGIDTHPKRVTRKCKHVYDLRGGENKFALLSNGLDLVTDSQKTEWGWQGSGWLAGCGRVGGWVITKERSGKHHFGQMVKISITLDRPC